MRRIITILFFGISIIFADDNMKTHHTADGFKNPFPGFKENGMADFFKWVIWDKITGNYPAKPDSYSFKVVPNDGEFLRQNKGQYTVTWVGHSTLLIQIGGMNILTDPIWSKRSSPVQFAGPARYVEAGIKFENLPPIDLVVISHDHYDHLDKQTIKKLGNRPHYLVPLRVGKYLEDWGIVKYQEFDWGDSIKVNNVLFICAPAQHFSGRSPFRRNDTLWSSWIIKSEDYSFYYGGDSGYFPGFLEIGEKYGPFDIAALPIGAYLPRWFMKPVHLNPEEAVQAYLDLQAQKFIAIHWGTFDLADEPLDWPPEHLRIAVDKKHLNPDNFLILNHGQAHILKENGRIQRGSPKY